MENIEWMPKSIYIYIYIYLIIKLYISEIQCKFDTCMHGECITQNNTCKCTDLYTGIYCDIR